MRRARNVPPNREARGRRRLQPLPNAPPCFLEKFQHPLHIAGITTSFSIKYLLWMQQISCFEAVYANVDVCHQKHDTNFPRPRTTVRHVSVRATSRDAIIGKPALVASNHCVLGAAGPPLMTRLRPRIATVRTNLRHRQPLQSAILLMYSVEGLGGKTIPHSDSLGGKFLYFIPQVECGLSFKAVPEVTVKLGNYEASASVRRAAAKWVDYKGLQQDSQQKFPACNSFAGAADQLVVEPGTGSGRIHAENPLTLFPQDGLPQCGSRGSSEQSRLTPSWSNSYLNPAAGQCWHVA
uniref:Uncharacterized protein n=1 Tax=Branchiostoma floridae TaxID=7739 RepID=C3ZR43_BRAFL|eukprot:XP_002588905.1 hypothetical protein BRAFLDRAFT_89093 [Branchiostoma floridae]